MILLLEQILSSSLILISDRLRSLTGFIMGQMLLLLIALQSFSAILKQMKFEMMFCVDESLFCQSNKNIIISKHIPSSQGKLVFFLSIYFKRACENKTKLPLTLFLSINLISTLYSQRRKTLITNWD